MKSAKSFIAAVLSLISVAAAVGGEYTDPSGFSFTYPDGWFAAAKFTKANLPAELANWIAKNHVDLSQVAVVLIHAGRGDFLDNLNVVVVHEEMPIDGSSVKQIEDGLPRQYRSMGISVENLDGHIQQIGNNKAIVFDYRSRLPGLGFPISQRQYYLPLAGNTYILTCTAKPDAFAKSENVFETIVESFSVGGSTAAQAPFGLNMDRTLIFGVIGGAVAGMIGALFAAWKSMRNREAEFATSGDVRYRGR